MMLGQFVMGPCWFLLLLVSLLLSLLYDFCLQLVILQKIWFDMFEIYTNISILIQNVNILTATARKGPVISNVSDRKRFDTDITS